MNNRSSRQWRLSRELLDLHGIVHGDVDLRGDPMRALALAVVTGLIRLPVSDDGCSAFDRHFGPEHSDRARRRARSRSVGIPQARPSLCSRIRHPHQAERSRDSRKVHDLPLIGSRGDL
jgi:hypothetical protein